MASIKEVLNRMQALDVEIKEKQSRLNTYKGKVKAFVLKNNKEFKGDFGSVYTIHKIDIDYDLKALKRKLGQELYDEVTDVNYSVDIPRLKRLLRKLDIPLKNLKGVVKSKRVLNEKNLDALYEDEIISLEDLDGCYEKRESRTVGFRFRQQEE